MTSRRTILIVEDHTDLRRFYRDALSLEGFEISEADSGYQALHCLDGNPIDLVVLDLGLPGYNGHVVRAKIAAYAPNVPIIVVTGTEDHVPHVPEVMRKPVMADQLVATVRRHLG